MIMSSDQYDMAVPFIIFLPSSGCLTTVMKKIKNILFMQRKNQRNLIRLHEPFFFAFGTNPVA